MALPTILVDSAGSDTLSSGAGPSTALNGTANASTDATGLIVTLPSGTVLTGVSTTGSDVIFLNDTTAGARNFGKITATAGSGGATPLVTVANAFGTALSGKSWAIGGKRATINGTLSRKLFDNNSTAGDAMPGWTIQMTSGYTETITSSVDLRRAGDATSGFVILQGDPTAVTPPILTFNINSNCFVVRGSFQALQYFETRNTNATKTASVAIIMASNFAAILLRGLKISHSTNKFWKGIVDGNGSVVTIRDCEVGYCANVGISWTGGQSVKLISSWVHDCGSHGLVVSTTALSNLFIYESVISFNAADGLNYSVSSAGGQNSIIVQSTFHGNTSDGIEYTQAGGNGSLISLLVLNNLLTTNGGYGINFSGATDIGVQASGVMLSGNGTGSGGTANTSGAMNPSLPLSWENSSASDPGYTNVGGNDFSISPTLAGTGYPPGGTKTIGFTSTYNYIDPGAAQRQEPVSGPIINSGF